MEEIIKKKILIVLYYYHPYVSGLSLLAKMLAEGLVARGHTVTVLALQHKKDSAELEVVNGVQVVRARVLATLGKGGLSWDFLQKVVALSKEHDIVNPHLPMAHFGLILPLIDKKKLVPQYHCDLNLGRGVISRLLQWFSYWSMERTLAGSSQIIVTSLDYFSHCHYAKHALAARQVYPPIDETRFGLCDADELKIKLGIKGSPYLIGFVGRIVAEKGLEYLVQAIPFLEEKHDDFLILIAGDYENIAGGSVRATLEVMINNFPGRVCMLGHLKFADLVSFYNLIDVLVLPSVDPLEAFGMVQIEAMLCGTPVIATDMPGVREVVRKTGFGKLVNKRDSKDIADKIDELIQQPLTLKEELIREFGYERSIAEYENIFAQIIDP